MRKPLVPFVFAEHDDINIDGAITRFVAQLLVHAADMAHGSPYAYASPFVEGIDVPDIEFHAWVFAMRLAAFALERYEVRFDVFGERRTKIERDAQDALVWVACWLPHLWD